MSDYMESLFQGVEILIDKKLEDLAYDTSLICCITDNSDSKNGKYRVTDGSVSYTVYSEDDSYKIGDYVRIIIPNNDYSQKKFISGKYVLDDNTVPITYVSSTDSVVNISGNLAKPIVDNTYGIVANGAIKQKTLWGYDFSEDEELENFQTNNICNTIILSADFQTLLSSYNLIEGTYGLLVELFVKPGPTSTGLIRKVIELNSSDMFGNPYNFSILSTQSKTFTFSVSNGLIQGINIILFQNGDFKDSSKGYIVPLQDKPDDILVSNISIGFGSNVVDMEDNIVELYSKQDLSYNYNPHSPATNLKEIGLLWYNKSEENKYLGFSDGLYDPDYDELDYLERSYVDARLVQQKGKINIPQDKIGLSIAADMYEVSSIVKQIINIANTDLINTFLNLKDEVKDVYSPTINTTNPSEANISISDFVDMNAKYGIQKLGASIEEELKKIKDAYNLCLKYIYENEQGDNKANINNLHLSTLKPLLQKFEIYSKTVVSNLKSYLVTNHYTAYNGLVDMYETRLARVYNTINSILNTFNLETLQPLTTINSYFKSASDLKVYAEQSFEEYDNKYCIYWYHYKKGHKESVDKRYQFLPEGWERLTFFDDYGNEIRNIGIPRYSPDAKQETNAEGQIINLVQPSMGEGLIQRYMQHDLTEEKYLAIIFYNHEMFKSEELIFTNSQDFTDKLTLDKSDSLSFNHKSNSHDSYLIYNELFYLKDSSDSQKLREVQCSYNGRLLQDDDVLPNASIYWYIPNTSTMLTYDIASLTGRGFVTDEGLTNKPSYSKDGFVCFYKKINATYNDATETYDYTKTTTINSESIIYDERSFWYMIKSYYEQTTTQNFIICKIVPEGESVADAIETKLFFNFGIAGTNGTKYTLAITSAGNQPCVTSSKSLTLNVSLRDANNEAIDIASTGYDISWDFKDGSKNVSAKKEKNSVVVSGSNCGILEFEVKNFSLSSGKKVNFSQKYPVAWGANNYYISGPTRIIYNSFGTLDRTSVFDIPYKLFNATTDTEITSGVTWSLEYYNKDGDKALTTNKADKFYIDHAPTINESGLLIPSPLYLDNIENEFFIVVIAKHNSSIVWRQPILIMQNRYGSPLMNEWNGEFDLDSDNGTLLASMIGAGRKNSKNTFEGVLMGDVGGSAAADKTGIGLYGYHEGAQSFGLMSDGTAFFGKAGKGRILIDGDDSTIQSASYQSSKGASGMCIDLDDGWISMSNNKARIKLQTLADPYFSIAAIIENAEKELIKISSSDYFLQTANFVQETRDTAGVGTRIDLETGQIDAYNFKLKSNRVLIDSSPKTSTYFKILSYDDTAASDNKELIYIGKNNYYFQTADYDKTTGEGAKFDLRSGEIESYKGFTLKAGTGTNFLGLSSTAFRGTVIGENDYWRILAGKNFGVSSGGKLYASGAYINGTVHIDSGSITIGGDNFTVTDAGNVTAKNINATGGSIGGWTLSGGNLSSGNMTIHGDGYISSHGDKAEFDVTAEGQLKAKSAIIQGEINAGSGYIGSWLISDGSLTNNTGSVKLTKDGTLYALAGTIGGWTIDGSTLKSSTMTLNGSTGTISAANGTTSFSVNSSGKMEAKSSVLEDLTVNKTFKTGAKCATTLDGTLKVTGNATIDGDFVLGGTVNFAPDKFTIGGVAPFASEEPISIRVDVPWSLTDYDLIIHNGLIKEVRTTNKSGEKKDVITYTAATSTVGASNNPVYLSNGVITASNTTIGGSAATPVSLQKGVFGLLTTVGIGKANQPIYLNAQGAITASDSTLGGETRFIYMENGQFKATSKTLGSKTAPLYLNKGAFTQCDLTHRHTAKVTVKEYSISGSPSTGYTLTSTSVEKTVTINNAL